MSARTPKCKVCGATVDPKKNPFSSFCDHTCRRASLRGLDRGAALEYETATGDLSNEAAAARRQFAHLDYLSDENQP
jgi:endogenous inhibitor of DNA gyrase (YacG/DUF329 family)